MAFNHPQLTGFAKEDFIDWYWFTKHQSPNDLPQWLIDDQLICFSKFFGYTINTLTKLKVAVSVYNNSKISTNNVNVTLNHSKEIVDNHGWIRIYSDRDFPKEEHKLVMYNFDKKIMWNKEVTRKTMWRMYKQGIITHYKFVLPIIHLPPIK